MNPATRNNSEFDRLDSYPPECICGPAIAGISDGPNTGCPLHGARRCCAHARCPGGSLCCCIYEVSEAQAESAAILDLYCCQGGASVGYANDGFDVFGVDKDPQPRYPFWFHQGDAIDVLRRLIRGESIAFHRGSETRWMSVKDFAAIHASPPCQFYSRTWRINKSEFPDLIGTTRYGLDLLGLPYVIENVVEAAPKMLDPAMLCGAMFGIETYRHRLFETNWTLIVPEHPDHVAKTTKMGRRPVDGEFMHIVGNFSGVDKAREIMGMPWANRDGLREAIPPAYTEWIGTQIIERLEEVPA